MAMPFVDVSCLPLFCSTQANKEDVADSLKAGLDGQPAERVKMRLLKISLLSVGSGAVDDRSGAATSSSPTIFITSSLPWAQQTDHDDCEISALVNTPDYVTFPDQALPKTLGRARRLEADSGLVSADWY